MSASVARRAPRTRLAPRWRAAAVACAVGVLLWPTACGDDGPGGSAAKTADVAITVDPDGAGARPARTARLRCPAPDASAACGALSDLAPEAFAPVPRGTICTQVYGGPQTATIRGTVAGRRVDAGFSRRDGCEIARYDRVARLLALAR